MSSITQFGENLAALEDKLQTVEQIIKEKMRSLRQEHNQVIAAVEDMTSRNMTFLQEQLNIIYDLRGVETPSGSDT